MDDRIKAQLAKLPGISTLLAQRDGAVAEIETLKAQLEAERSKQGLFPAGHFYSPIPSADEIRRDAPVIFADHPRVLPGIALDDAGQLALLRSFIAYYDEMSFTASPQDGLRYFYDNDAYSYCDAILLHCMIRHLEPKRIIEVGSGYSSCMTLDTNDLHFDGGIETTFIEPYPELLEGLLGEGDRDHVRIIPSRLQDVDVSEFDRLEAGDIFFVDSTHVSKVGSDVNRIVFEILPRLAPGVHVHVHDIFHPFEYPRAWIEEGRAWNEIYLLRAFLQYNSAFEIVLMNTYMEEFHADFFSEHMPLCLENPGGSIWLRRKDTP
jgi:hypothetical protein